MRCCCCDDEDSWDGVGPTEEAYLAEDMDDTLVVPLVATLEFPPIPLSLSRSTPPLVDEENALLSALALLWGVDTNRCCPALPVEPCVAFV